ncbi:hypothetical protein DACRYDRAFT_22031 [Dacryopinax primogenitus]|uniref:RRM domain-containing protein n=1 Tax=Dacryopinax primogenitus (strain DJM 731) TaxID=1858805 RepID=M5GDF9_DACPD|nr:uncharacterized protein DACRYDRAFT_22031 [Dacryopinax primogenitus]EJU02358.1 hypothetical protein DACRYDRAFT_22031 [Dacryopinax primogenitus]
MASGLDKSLDDMIKSKPRPQRRRRVPTAKAAVLGAGNLGAGAAVKAAARQAALPTPKAAEPTVTQAQQEARKIIVSNLPLDVSETQIKELFGTTVGKTREVNLAFNNKGQSKGIAHVTFTNKGDGFKAYKEYNGRLIDAKSPMKIELILEPVKPAPPTLASRVAPTPKVAPAAPRAATNGTASATRGAAARGRGRGGRGGRTRRAPKSAADLDQEMEEYVAAPATDAGAPAAAPAPAA